MEKKCTCESSPYPQQTHYTVQIYDFHGAAETRVPFILLPTCSMTYLYTNNIPALFSNFSVSLSFLYALFIGRAQTARRKPCTSPHTHNPAYFTPQKHTHAGTHHGPCTRGVVEVKTMRPANLQERVLANRPILQCFCDRFCARWE